MTLETISRPRLVVGGNKKLKALVPSHGIVFVHLERDAVLQYLGDHWEIIAQRTVGKPPFSDSEMEQMKIQGQTGYSALGGSSIVGDAIEAIEDTIAPDPLKYQTPEVISKSVKSPGGGGGGVSPSPRKAGDPNLTSAMPGVTDVAYHGARIAKLANQFGATPQNHDPFPFDTSLFDPSGLRVGSTIVVDKAGRWNIRAFLSARGSTVQELFFNAIIKVNGNAVATKAMVHPNLAGAGFFNTISYDYDVTLAVGDIIRLQITSTLTGGGNITLAGDYAGGTTDACFLEAYFLGTV